MQVAVLLFTDFETLDVFGPVEIFGRSSTLYSIGFFSLNGGQIKNKDGVTIATEKLETLPERIEVLLIPGGIGTRNEVDNEMLINKIVAISRRSNYVLTVCTGSALLARTRLLDNRKATTNKMAFSWVVKNGKDVIWDKRARWVVDEKFYTSSGVSAGMDMTLGFLSDRHGVEFARKIAKEIEYTWTLNKDDDSFIAE